MITFAAVLLFSSGTALAQMYVYPAKGQSQAQQNRDQGECHQWAARQTGYDPSAAARVRSGTQPSGGVVRGAARGALAGVAIGAIAGDAGKGAAIGATAGGMGGGFRQRDQRMRIEAERRALENEQQARQIDFQRAFAVCMEGRGYTVK